MRRLTPRYKQWLAKRARYESARRGRATRWVVSRVAWASGGRLVRTIDPEKLPPVLCLDDAYDDTIAFIHNLRLRTRRTPAAAVYRQMRRHKGRVGWLRNYQDFKSLRHISPGAALLVCAEYDLFRQLAGVPLSVIDLEDWDDRVFATLSQLGFFNLLDVFKVPQRKMPEGFYIQPLASEMAVNSQPAVDRIVDLFAKAGGDRKLRLELSGAVVDALENVRNHAYPEDCFRGIRHLPNWWFVGAADSETRALTLAVYDQGITIPVSLPRRFAVSRISEVFRSMFGLTFDPLDHRLDGKALAAAMELSATSTGQPHRGKGLAKIGDVVRSCDGGRLRVVSRNGEFNLDSKGQRETTHDVSLPGTFIEIEALF
jgi:hypothetical protein